MNAKEARERAEQANNTNDNGTISTIETIIKARSADGKFSIDYNGQMSNVVKKHFEDLGYQIGSRMSGPNEECFVISW